MKFYKFIIIIFLFQWKLNIKCKIVFPIETLTSDNYIIYSNDSHQKIMQNSLYKNIYTSIEIGTPVQKVPLLINTREPIFQITGFTPGNSMLYHLLFNLSSIFHNYDFFKENNSFTFKTDGCVKSNNMFDDHLYDCSSYETVKLNNNYLGNIIEIKNFEFNLVKQKEDNITGILGLGLFDKNEESNKSLMKILKDKNIINNYNWYFSFNSWNDTNIKLIIGSLPHEDYPNNFLEEDLVYTYIQIPDYSFSDMKYMLVLDEIKTNSINLINIYAELSFDSNVLIANKEFENELRKKFLKNLEISEKCFKASIKQNLYYYNDLIYYYCDININDILYENLPFIKFISKDLNYTFEITKDELYKTEGDYIYINLLFDYGKKYWVLGKPFSLKYHFIFNQDSKKIGLYRKYYENIYINKDNNKNESNKIINIVLIIIFSFCLIFIGFYLGKKIYQIKRKIRANELNDNYEYINENNNKDNKFNEIIDNEGRDKNLSIEMGIKL